MKFFDKNFLSIANTSIAEIVSVSFPAWAALHDNSSLPADSVWMKAVDLNDKVTSDDTNITLGTITIRGDNLGITSLTAVVTKMDDDDGDPINPSTELGYVHVEYIPPPPIASIIPLRRGWNLISVPVNLTTWELGEESMVGDPLNVTPRNSLTSIYRYNTTSGLFEKCDHLDDWGWSPATGSEGFTELEPGRGYWVMAKNDCVWTFLRG